jgi:DNA polymerase-3 subunit gamma/tau
MSGGEPSSIKRISLGAAGFCPCLHVREHNPDLFSGGGGQVYQALYRKWRPNVFEDVVGQPHITTTLKNEIVKGSVAHAYLFTGSRGTGKTTCAKILAKAVNCLAPHDGNPCNECENCRGIEQGAIMDVVEIDAASNNGVDNIRDLREEAVFSPVVAKYRVYIIDEAHMLTGGAFNALLKTLEEPPAYVIFILATTEVHKIPATILSRCQRFDFRRISIEGIASRLDFVAVQEHIKLTRGASELIARLADGAMRDALSLLDRCAGVSGGTVDEESVTSAAGLSGREYIFEMSGAVRDGDFAAAIKTLDRLYDQSKDVERLCEELINHFRNIMLLKSSKDTAGILNCAPDETEKLKSEAAGFSPEAVLHILDTLRHTLEALRRSASRRVEMEMCLLRLCSPELDSSNAALLRRVASLEENIRSGVALAQMAIAPVKMSAEAVREQAKKPDSHEPFPAPEPEPETARSKYQTDINEAEEPLGCWPEVLESIEKLNAPLGGFLKGSSAVLHGEYVLVDSSNSMFADFIRKAEHQRTLLEAVQRATGRPYKVGIYKRALSAPKAENDRMDELLKNASDIGIEIKEK